VQAAAEGAELPISYANDPEAGAIVARYVDSDYVATLWLYEDDSYDTGWYHDVAVFKRSPDSSLERSMTAGTDWYGAPGTTPREFLFLSGFRCGVVGGPAFVTGAVRALAYRRLLRHFGSGEAIDRVDAPLGAFVARID